MDVEARGTCPRGQSQQAVELNFSPRLPAKEAPVGGTGRCLLNIRSPAPLVTGYRLGRERQGDSTVIAVSVSILRPHCEPVWAEGVSWLFAGVRTPRGELPHTAPVLRRVNKGSSLTQDAPASPVFRSGGAKFQIHQ